MRVLENGRERVFGETDQEEIAILVPMGEWRTYCMYTFEWTQTIIETADPGCDAVVNLIFAEDESWRGAWQARQPPHNETSMANRSWRGSSPWVEGGSQRCTLETQERM